MILQDSNNKISTFHRCPHIIPKTRALENNSSISKNNYFGFYLYIVFIVLFKHNLNWKYTGRSMDIMNNEHKDYVY